MMFVFYSMLSRRNLKNSNQTSLLVKMPGAIPVSDHVCAPVRRRRTPLSAPSDADNTVLAQNYYIKGTFVGGDYIFGSKHLHQRYLSAEACLIRPKPTPPGAL
jgi:hypothetical protein